MTIQAQRKIVYWEDVKEGQEVPPINLDITIKRCVMGVAGTRDYYDVHHNRDFAKANAAKDMFVNTMFLQGTVARFMTDWTGPEGEIRKLGIAMRESNYPGDILTVTGKVIKKYQNAKGEHLVDLDIVVSNPRGSSVISTGTMALPVRASRG